MLFLLKQMGRLDEPPSTFYLVSSGAISTTTNRQKRTKISAMKKLINQRGRFKDTVAGNQFSLLRM